MEYNLHRKIDELVKSKGISEFDVYIKKNNMKNYYIDLSPIEEWEE